MSPATRSPPRSPAAATPPAPTLAALAGFDVRRHHGARRRCARACPTSRYIESAAAHAGSRPAATGATRHPRVDDLPGHDRRAARADPRGGLRAGRRAPTSIVGYSPERIDPGNATWTLREHPQGRLGHRRGVARRGAGLLRRARRQRPCRCRAQARPSSRKLLENTFRHVNIALVNELAMFAGELGIDVWEAIDAASTKPFGYMRFTPGPGCRRPLPADRPELPVVAGEAVARARASASSSSPTTSTTHMPDYVVRRLTLALNEQGRAVNGRTDPASRPGLQAQHRRRPRVAVARRRQPARATRCECAGRRSVHRRGSVGRKHRPGRMH